MNITKVTIDNFRNINHAEYDLKRINLFTGPNQTGKTNSILAIYWAMTDLLMDGSSDYASFKPQSDKKALVSVELQFDDESSLKKTFAEKWTRTRGSSVETMTGHETIYYIDGVKTTITKAKTELLKRFGVSKFEIDAGKFTLLPALINPYYFAKQVEWKDLRKFVIWLCGDVSNEEIFESDQKFEPIRDRLLTDHFDTSLTLKYYNQQLKLTKNSVEEYKVKNKGLMQIPDVSKEDLRNAHEKIDLINEQIQSIKSGDGNSLMIDKIKENIKSASAEVDQCVANDTLLAAKANEKVDQEILKKQEEVSKGIEMINKASESANAAGSELKTLEWNISIQEEKVKSAQSVYSECGVRYDNLKTWTPPETVVCPHCGGILNQDHVDEMIKDHQAQVDECITVGKTAKIDLENNSLKLEELKKQLPEANEKLRKANFLYVTLKDHLQVAKDQIEVLQRSKKPVEYSQATKTAMLRLEDWKNKLQTEESQQLASNFEINEKIKSLEEEKKMPQIILNTHIAFEANQKQIKDNETEIAKHQNLQVNIETSIALTKEFIQKKLDLFNKKVSDTFKDMKFQLIQENIKEGSWNEVCIPMIVGKDTPFEDGSGSEQILTGIYFAEKIKEKLGIDDLPYIFDECDKLDTAHLEAVDTRSQIISTIVNDVDYSRITLISKD